MRIHKCMHARISLRHDDDCIVCVISFLPCFLSMTNLLVCADHWLQLILEAFVVLSDSHTALHRSAPHSSLELLDSWREREGEI